MNSKGVRLMLGIKEWVWREIIWILIWRGRILSTRGICSLLKSILDKVEVIILISNNNAIWTWHKTTLTYWDQHHQRTRWTFYSLSIPNHYREWVLIIITFLHNNTCNNSNPTLCIVIYNNNITISNYCYPTSTHNCSKLTRATSICYCQHKTKILIKTIKKILMLMYPVNDNILTIRLILIFHNKISELIMCLNSL